MEACSKIDRMRSRLYIYRQGLIKAQQAKNQTQVSQWENSIANLEQEIEDMSYPN